MARAQWELDRTQQTGIIVMETAPHLATVAAVVALRCPAMPVNQAPT